ncbi:MAG: hypothetical protein EOP49_44240, partial [Sphingobacteriales bacterium]
MGSGQHKVVAYDMEDLDGKRMKEDLGIGVPFNIVGSAVQFLGNRFFLLEAHGLLRDWLNATLKNQPIAQVKMIEEIARLGREKQKQFLR